MSYSELLLCVYACSSLGMGAEILYRSTAGGGAWCDLRLRSIKQAANAAMAITAAPTPTPTPILAASVRPAFLFSAASELVAAGAADVLETALVGAVVEVASVVDCAVEVAEVTAVAEVLEVSGYLAVRRRNWIQWISTYCRAA